MARHGRSFPPRSILLHRPAVTIAAVNELNQTLGDLTCSATGTVPFLPISGIGQTAGITLAWDPSTGAVGYKIYFGTASGIYTSVVDVGNVLIYRIENLPNGTYYFSVTAYNASNEESGFSTELVDTITAINGIYFSSLGLRLAATGTTTGAIVTNGTLNQTLGPLTMTGQVASSLYVAVLVA